MKRQHLVRLCRAGIFAALYVALTFVTASVAISEIQFRPSEALTMLPLLFPEAIPALFIGCMIGNWIAGGAILDIILGSLVTLVAAVCTWLVGKFIRNFKLSLVIGGLFPVLLNALLLPGIWRIAYGQQEFGYWLNVAFLLASQSIVIFPLGIPLTIAAKAYLKFESRKLTTAAATAHTSERESELFENIEDAAVEDSVPQADAGADQNQAKDAQNKQ